MSCFFHGVTLPHFDFVNKYVFFMISLKQYLRCCAEIRPTSARKHASNHVLELYIDKMAINKTTKAWLCIVKSTLVSYSLPAISVPIKVGRSSMIYLFS